MDFYYTIDHFVRYWLNYLMHAWQKAGWVDRGFVIYFTLIIIGWFLTDDKEDATSPNPTLAKPTAIKNKLLISKAGYVREVVRWCTQYLGVPSRGCRFPEIIISYYPHKKLHGNYAYNCKRIQVYVNNHENLLQLTDTVIHEYIHFLEIRSHAHQKDYNKHMQQIGYHKNPYEISARTQAAQHVNACLFAMKQKGYWR
ncbi:MAG: hypothetical protein WCH59_05425 [Chitinophagia bacterium]